MLGLLAYISVAGAWFWARSLHPAIVTWPTRITTGTRWRRESVGRGGVHPGWRHATQPQERACRQGWGAALPLAGMTGHQRLVRAGGRRLPRETLSCSHQRLARARTTLAIARQGGLPVPMRGSVVSLRPGCPPDTIQTASSFLESSPSTRNVHRVGFAGVRAGKRGVCKRGKVCPCRGWQGEHAGRWRGGTVGAGLCSGTRPTVFRSVRCQKCQQGGRTTHHLQMTTPSCEKLTRADREPRGEHRMPPT